MFSDASPVRGAIIRYGSGSGRVLSLTTTTTTRFYYVKEKNIKGTVGGYMTLHVSNQNVSAVRP